MNKDSKKTVNQYQNFDDDFYLCPDRICIFVNEIYKKACASALYVIEHSNRETNVCKFSIDEIASDKGISHYLAEMQVALLVKSRMITKLSDDTWAVDPYIYSGVELCGNSFAVGVECKEIKKKKPSKRKQSIVA